jgi:chromatin remodeling complex protein RSC6
MATKRKATKRKATKRKATKRKATKRKATKRKATKRKATKRKATKRKAKKAFGGYSISFKNRVESLEQIFGKADIPPSEMTKKLWKFIKNKRLGHK